MTRRLLRSARVRSLLRKQVRFERGSPSTVSGPRVAVVAHWSRHHLVSPSACALVRELQAAGYRVVVSSASPADHPLEWDDAIDVDDLVVIRKPNVGYDFGSWTAALWQVPQVAHAEYVILANDSMVGPFRSLAPLVERFEGTSADVWGLTDTGQFGEHLQSYFLGFRGGVLADGPLARFWAGIRHETDKMRIIFENEIGLSRLLDEEGYSRQAAFPHELIVGPGQNPVIIGWKRLLDRGFPFVKREILRNPSVAPAGDTVPIVLRQDLDIDVSQWLSREEQGPKVAFVDG